jgi:hypothetical protein
MWIGVADPDKSARYIVSELGVSAVFSQSASAPRPGQVIRQRPDQQRRPLMNREGFELHGEWNISPLKQVYVEIAH